MSSGPSGRHATLERDVAEVKVIMGQNVRDVLHRGDNLEALEIKAERLVLLTGEFKKVCGRCRSQLWCHRHRDLIIIALVSTLLTVIIVLVVALVLILTY